MHCIDNAKWYYYAKFYTMNYITFNKPYKWYAVYTKSRAEKKVHSELIRKGIEAYLPLVKTKRQWCDRIKTVEEPLLRGYVFVKVSNKEYYDALITPGAIRYICFEGRPAAIPDCQIDDLKTLMERGTSGLEVTSERIRKGDIIRVVAGPLQNVNGEVVEIRGKRRILLRFDSLGYSIHAELGVNKIELLKKNVGKRVTTC